MRHRVIATTSLVALAWSLPASGATLQGQEPSALPAAPPAQDTTPAEPNGGLQDIVVTAQKRSESMQRVPIAVTAASGEDLVSRGVINIQQLNTVAAGVNLRSATGSFQPFIRGIGTSSTVTENPVALYVDGVYLPSQRDGPRNLADVEQIAVLKGPQGTLFGRNATGGVVQITTLAPSQTFRASLGAEVDNYLTFRGNAYVSGGLADGLAGSVAATYATQGNGWGSNLTTGRDTFRVDYDFAARAKLLLNVGPDTNFTLIGDYIDRRQFTDGRQPYRGLPLQFPGTGPLSSPYDTYGGKDSYSAFRGGGGSLTIDHDFGFAKFTSISALRKGEANYLFDNSAVAAPLFIVRTPKTTNRSYSQELQLVSQRSTGFTWAVGVFYFNNRTGAEPIIRDFSGFFTPAPTSTRMNTTFAREQTESVAPFAQATLEFLPATKLTGGVRYTHEKRTLTDASSSNLLVNGNIVTSRFAPPSLTIDEPTYRVALDHQFTPTILGYVSFNTGIKSGGFNVVTPASPAYLPEKLKAWEVGLKTELFDRHLRFNAAAYYYKYTNLQVIQFVGVTQTVVNGPAARFYGLDLEFEALVSDGLRLSGNVALEKSEFTSYPGAVFSEPRPTGGARIFAGNATGNRPPLAQDISGTLAVDYKHELKRGSLSFNLTANYNGDYYFEADNFLRQNSYVLLNSLVKWNIGDSPVSLTLFGRNLLDKKVIAQAISQSFGYVALYSNAPRTYGVGLNLKF